MALKAVLDTLDGVDDAAKPFYAEANGRYVLKVEGVDDHPEVANLRNAYARTKEDREKAKGEAAALKAQIADLQKGAPDTAATQAKLTQLQEQLAAKQAEAQQWQGKYTSVTRDQSLAQALQAAGITNPTFVKAATTMLAGMVKIGEDGTVYAETPMGPKMVQDFVKSWASGDGKDFVSAPAGGGAQGSRGGNAAGAKTMSRAEFDGLTPEARVKAAREGVTLTD
jgi:hypothetical protein